MIPRYFSIEVNQVFQDQNKYAKWLEIEKLHLRYLCNERLISESAYKKLDTQLSFSLIEIAAEELVTKHDFVAFINVISRKVNIPEKKWIHYGLTTTDVVDTANALLLKEVNALLVKKITTLKLSLKDLAYEYKDLPQIGRTHGIHAEITSFGYKFAIFYDDINNALEHFYLARKQVECAKISGSVGTFANTSLSLQDYIAEHTGLMSSNCGTQVLSRERYMGYFNSLNSLGQTINKIATELRHLARTEINEINEFFDKDQIGSSSMPHKKNPVVLENICGLSRLLKSYSFASADNVPLWNERDISHSSVERVLMLDATTILFQIITKLTDVLNTMSVNKDSIQKNIELTKGNIFSQAALLKLIEKKLYGQFTKSLMSREDLLLEVKKVAQQVVDKNSNFKEELVNSWVGKSLTPADIQEIFDPQYHLKHMDEVYDRIFIDCQDSEQFSAILWNKYDIDLAVERLAQQLNAHYKHSLSEVIVLSTLDGSIVFTGNLLTKLNFKVKLVSCKVSFYGEAPQINKNKAQDFHFDPAIFKGKEVLILDDLLDTGETLLHITKALKSIGAQDIKTCVLFTKDQYKIPKIQADWFGLDIPDEWVLGYGIDSNKLHRNLNFLAVLKKDGDLSVDEAHKESQKERWAQQKAAVQAAKAAAEVYEPVQEPQQPEVTLPSPAQPQTTTLSDIPSPQVVQPQPSIVDTPAVVPPVAPDVPPTDTPPVNNPLPIQEPQQPEPYNTNQTPANHNQTEESKKRRVKGSKA